MAAAFAAPTPEEEDAETAKLIAEGASPDDLFIRLVPFESDPTSHMLDDYRWEGRWVGRDGRDDADIAQLAAEQSAKG